MLTQDQLQLLLDSLPRIILPGLQVTIPLTAVSFAFGLVIALALSPYGIPMLAALILARFYGLRYWLKDTIYG